MDPARRLVQGMIGDLEERLSASLLDHNAKGRFQEQIQREGWSTEDIDYRMVDSTGPGHDRRFEVDLYFKGERVGTGKGSSRKSAENRAAQAALDRRQSSGPQ
jgi:ribonuclease-3